MSGFKETPAIPSQQPSSPEPQAQAAAEAPAPSQAAPPVPAEGYQQVGLWNNGMPMGRCG